MSKLTIGTLSNILTHGETLCQHLIGANTAQTASLFKGFSDNPALLQKLILALRCLEIELRVIRAVTLDDD